MKKAIILSALFCVAAFGAWGIRRFFEITIES
jgi:hypothetical protein